MLLLKEILDSQPRRGPFTSIPDHVFDLHLSPHALRIYVHLKMLHDLGRPGDGLRQTARACNMAANTVRRYLIELENQKLVVRVGGVSFTEARRLLINKSSQSHNIGTLGAVCSWCGCFTAWLHDHHYPVPKSEGGEATVQICPNCHAEFHALTRDTYIIAEASR